MRPIILETLGTVRQDGTLELDQKLAVPPGRVKVRLEMADPHINPKDKLSDFVNQCRRDLEAGNHKFMNDTEVTAWINELRSDDERIDNIYRQAE